MCVCVHCTRYVATGKIVLSQCFLMYVVGIKFGGLPARCCGCSHLRSTCIVEQHYLLEPVHTVN